MFLKSLILHNIRSYTDAEMEFPAGSILLSGDIGAGKSTVLYAIEFALFGILRGELSGDSLLRNGCASGFIELSFMLDKQDITIHRTLKHQKESVKQDAGFMILNGQKLDLTAVEMRTRILDLLGYPPELVTKSPSLIYRYTVYTPQDMMQHILFDDPAARLDTIRKICGVDKYNRILENSEIVLKQIKEKRKEHTLLLTDVDEKKSVYDEVRQHLLVLEKSVADAKQMLESAREKTCLVRKRLELCTRAHLQFLEQKKELSLLNVSSQEKETYLLTLARESEDAFRKRDELAAKIRTLPDVSLEPWEISLQEQIAKKEEEYLQVFTKKSALYQTLSFLEKKQQEIVSLLEQKEVVLKKGAEKKEQIRLLQEEIVQKQSLIQRKQEAEMLLQKTLRALQQYEIFKKQAVDVKTKIETLSHCPTCLQPVYMDHKHAVIAEQLTNIELYQDHITQLRTQQEAQEQSLKEAQVQEQLLAEKEKQYERYAAEITQLIRVEDEIAPLVTQLTDSKQQQQTLHTEYAAIPDVSAMKQELVEKKMLLEQYEQKKNVLQEKQTLTLFFEEQEKQCRKYAQQKQSASEELTILRSKCAQLQQHIDTDQSTVEKETCEKELDATLREERVLDVRLSAFVKEQELEQKRYAELVAELEKKKKLQEELISLAKKQDWLTTIFQPLVRSTEKHVLTRIYQDCAALFQQWAGILIEDEQLQYRLGEDFTPYAVQNGHPIAISFLSGGEKTGCALAYRLALNKIINDFVSSIKTHDLLILDEPTDGFSTEQLDTMRDVLDQLRIKQIIIVSHEQKMESFVDHVLHVVKANHESKVL